MGNTKYEYAIYKNDFPVFFCENVEQLAIYFNLPLRTIYSYAGRCKRIKKELCQINCFYDEEYNCYDYSQLYFKTKSCEVYRFWSSTNV